jgi:antagonist of KipI
MLEILEAGGLLAVQDSGRRGWQKFGVPISGPMDWYAFRAANALVGNDVHAAALEIGFGEVTLRAQRDCVIAVTGAGFVASTYVWTFPLWNSFYVRSGWIVHVMKQGEGNWAYLAAAGGIEVEPVLGSRSTYLRAGLGGNLQAGDVLKAGRPSAALGNLAARSLSETRWPVYSQSPVIEVIQGPQSDWFTQDGLDTFYSCSYSVSPSSDRMGYRLEGQPVGGAPGADLLSEGLAMGSIQVPANGQPIVMMADCGTTGGYPKIANVITADLPMLAQVAPRTGSIRFKMTTVEEAQTRYRNLLQDLDDGFEKAEDDSNFAQ